MWSGKSRVPTIRRNERMITQAPKMIPLLRAIVPSSTCSRAIIPATCHAVVRMAPRAVAASIGSGGNALTSTCFGGKQQAPINRSAATSRIISPMIGQIQSRSEPFPLSFKWELNVLSKYPVSYLGQDPALPWTFYPNPASTCPYNGNFIRTIRPKSTLAPGAVHVGGLDDTRQQQRFALRGEDLSDIDESEPLDDRDTLSQHTHHKDDTIPMDDRDFVSIHTHYEEDPSVPLDDRDFDSHHTDRPRALVGTDEQKMRKE